MEVGEQSGYEKIFYQPCASEKDDFQVEDTIGKVDEWLLCARFPALRKFFLGIIYRINDAYLLQQVVSSLSAIKQKDFTYSRSQCNSSLLVEHQVLPRKQSRLTHEEIETQIRKIWFWFSAQNNRNKATFTFHLANQIKNSSILYQALNLAKVLFLQQCKKDDSNSICSDESSLLTSNYSFHTDEHPNIYILSSANSTYEILKKEIDNGKAEVEYFEEDFDKTSMLSEEKLSSRSLDPRLLVVSHSKQALSGITPFYDFILKLPIHLSKKIIGLLDRSNQSNAALVNKVWHKIVRQVQLELQTRREIIEEAVMMQGVSAKGAHPNYANKKFVPVPVFLSDTHQRITMDQLCRDQESGSEIDEVPVISGCKIEQFEMEERNVYCGSYNVLILDKKRDKYRVMHYGGGEVVAAGSSNRVIRLYNIKTGREIPPSIRGHPGSIKSLFVADPDKKYIFSGSYDTTIRRWRVGSSSCHQIMHGHSKSIIALDYCNGVLVSGSKDGLIKIWNIQKGKCTCTFRHGNYSFVTCVKIRENTIVSSCDRAMIKVWDLTARKLRKTLLAHSDVVTQVSMDDHYIVSSSHDQYVFTWIKEGNITQPVKSYRHPKEVLCVELCYLRIISGCADGKIRVLHLHTGECLRVIRGNSKCEPILSLCATDNRLIVNMESNLLLLQFEHLELKYDVKYDQAADQDVGDVRGAVNSSSFRSNSYVRAFRNRASSITCSNISCRPLSAPVRKHLPVMTPKRALSSLPSLAVRRDLQIASTLHDRPKSGRSVADLSSTDWRRNYEDNFNVHNSKAMSVISGISSVIFNEEQCLEEKLQRRSDRRRQSRVKSFVKTCESFLPRDQLHLKIATIRHNINNNAEDINTALNGAHPDVREVYHSMMTGQ